MTQEIWGRSDAYPFHEVRALLGARIRKRKAARRCVHAQISMSIYIVLEVVGYWRSTALRKGDTLTSMGSP